ncbi:hypothetical protein K7J14_08015 [Treponema zuelzerae]|uniref:Uncharacterized protein n=1 Tax=Teretinema zuelzerae TaxID=156 RepID=A0AAE3EJI6_9SPIR|nr:hypothetical protein [Teretinema zuelzerae]MCD1654649.1 hypothetical protein [Teretinema zuelzerae]
MIKVYYRISDKGNPKEKILNAGKMDCLCNAIREFGKEQIYVIADNCELATIDNIRNMQLSYEETSLGNSASFIYMIKKIIASHNPFDYVYLLEDDYIHLPGSKISLEEGLAISDYVTLYDHPDKYIIESTGGSPFNFNKFHKTRLYVTPSSHWRETDSTTMSFACKVATLIEDLQIWEKYTNGRIPDDFHGFMSITQGEPSDFFSYFLRRMKKETFILGKNILFRKKLKKLISAVPAKATHAEVKYLAPVIDWNNT